MVHLSEILSPVTPAESRGRMQSQMIEFEFSGVDWEMVPESKLVSEGEAIIGWGGYPGSYDTVETDGFEAVVGYFDSALSETNVVYITNSNAYVYEFVLEQVSQDEIRAEVFRVTHHASLEFYKSLMQ